MVFAAAFMMKQWDRNFVRLKISWTCYISFQKWNKKINGSKWLPLAYLKGEKLQFTVLMEISNWFFLSYLLRNRSLSVIISTHPRLETESKTGRPKRPNVLICDCCQMNNNYENAFKCVYAISWFEIHNWKSFKYGEIE